MRCPGGGTNRLGGGAASAIKIRDGAGEHCFIAIHRRRGCSCGATCRCVLFFGDRIDPPDRALGGAAIASDRIGRVLRIGIGDDGPRDKQMPRLNADLNEGVTNLGMTFGSERGNLGQNLFDRARLQIDLIDAGR